MMLNYWMALKQEASVKKFKGKVGLNICDKNAFRLFSSQEFYWKIQLLPELFLKKKYWIEIFILLQSWELCLKKNLGILSLGV